MDYKMDYKNVNDPELYLESGNMRMKREMGKTKGKKEKVEYGSSDDNNNAIYYNRGMQSPDEKRLLKQAKPNDRMYNYLE